MNKPRAAAFSVTAGLLLTGIKLACGYVTNSTAVLSEALHSGLDAVAAMGTYLGVAQAGKPADERHRFGHGKFENLAAIAEGALMLGAAVFIFWRAVERLLVPAPVEALGLGLAVMGLSGLVNLAVGRYLLRVGRATDSPALRADGWHLFSEALASFGVLAGLALIRFTGLTVVDPLLAMGIGVVVLRAACGVLRESLAGMLDVSLPEADERLIRGVLERYTSDFLEFHELRTRKSGSERHIDLHLVVPHAVTVRAAHELCARIERDIKEALPNSHVLVHLEPCRPACEECLRRCDEKTCGPAGAGDHTDSQRPNSPPEKCRRGGDGGTRSGA
ncbi:MAG: cation transporter [Firmicutes bacterium]|nr:cation transporter [Bacillota bacterium]